MSNISPGQTAFSSAVHSLELSLHVSVTCNGEPLQSLKYKKHSSRCVYAYKGLTQGPSGREPPPPTLMVVWPVVWVSPPSVSLPSPPLVVSPPPSVVVSVSVPLAVVVVAEWLQPQPQYPHSHVPPCNAHAALCITSVVVGFGIGTTSGIEKIPSLPKIPSSPKIISATSAPVPPVSTRSPSALPVSITTRVEEPLPWSFVDTTVPPPFPVDEGGSVLMVTATPPGPRTISLLHSGQNVPTTFPTTFPIPPKIISIAAPTKGTSTRPGTSASKIVDAAAPTVFAAAEAAFCTVANAPLVSATATAPVTAPPPSPPLSSAATPPATISAICSVSVIPAVLAAVSRIVLISAKPSTKVVDPAL